MDQITANKQVRQAILSVLFLLAAFLFIKSIAGIQMIFNFVDQNYNMISVSGKGEVVAVADIATFSYTIEETGKTIAEAQEKSTEKTNKAIQFLKDAGVEDRDIKTTSYNTYPKYQYSVMPCNAFGCGGTNSSIVGYTVSQSIEVKVRDTKMAGDLLTKIGSVGVQYVSGLKFTIDDEEALKAKARDLAIANAKENAKKLAKSLGISLGDVSSFYENQDSVYTDYAVGSQSDGGEFRGGIVKVASPELPSGENTIKVNVTVTYKIK